MMRIDNLGRRFVRFVSGAALVPAALAQSPAPYFSEIPNAFPDIAAYYFALGVDTGFTNNRVSIVNVAVADVNLDGRPDIIAHLHKFQDVNGTLEYGPSPNRLVVMLQQPDGTFVDGTATVFGTNVVDLGGISRKHVVADFNGDGFPDIAYAMNREDGRAASGPPSNGLDNVGAQQSVMMSNGDGTYRIDRLANADWGHGVALAANGTATPDVVFSGFYMGAQGFRWSAGAWQPVSGYPYASPNTAKFFSDPPGGVANRLASTEEVYPPVGGPYANLFVRDAMSGNWSKTSTYLIGGMGTPIQMYTYDNVTLGPASVVRIDGEDYVGGSLYNTCTLVKRPAETPVIVHSWNTAKIPGGYTGQTLYQTQLPPFTKLLGFTYAGNQLAPSTFNAPLGFSSLNVSFIGCENLSGRSFGDMVLHAVRGGGTPVILANDGNGSFSQVDPALLPRDMRYGEMNSVLADLNGDGLKDMLLFQTSSFYNISPPFVRFGLYRAARAITPRLNQTITFPAIAGKAMDQSPLALSATAGAGTVVTYSSLSPTVCSVTGASATLLAPGTCTIAADQAGNIDFNPALRVSRSFFVRPAGMSPTLVLQSVVSRKNHGAAGAFDWPLRLPPAALSVEPRAIGAGHTLIFTFNNAVNFVDQVDIVDDALNTAGVAAPIFSSNTITVTLTGVADNRRVQVRIGNVNNEINAVLPVGFLLGDLDESRAVNGLDLSGVKARSGQVASSNNFQFDINASGSINAADVATVKARSGKTLP